MNLSPCAGTAACPPQVHCPACPAARGRARACATGTAQVPVRRFGSAPPPPQDLFLLADADSDLGPRTIGERGGLAVCAAALLAALVAGALLYA